MGSWVIHKRTKKKKKRHGIFRDIRMDVGREMTSFLYKNGGLLHFLYLVQSIRS